MPALPPVTIVIHELHPYGGQERVTYEFVRRLLERGAEVTVIARRCELPPSERLRWVRVRGPKRPFLLAYPWFFLAGTIATAIRGKGFRQTCGAIVFNKVDAVTIHCCHQGYSKVPATETRGRTSFLHTVSAKLSSLVSVWAERLCFRPSRVRTLIAVSAGMADELRRSFPKMASRVKIIPNGVDLDEFRPDPEIRSRMRSSLGIGQDELLAVFVGGAWARKGGPVAWAGVREAGSWSLLVGGYAVPEAERQTDGHPEARERLHLAGYGEDLLTSEVYATGDVLVFPTSYEGFSLATLEAAAAGLPLLMTPVHGAEELVVEGETGYLIDRTPDSIRDALEALSDDPALLRRMSEGARRVAERYTWDDVARMYESLIAGHDQAPAELEPAR